MSPPLISLHEDQRGFLFKRINLGPARLMEYQKSNSQIYSEIRPKELILLGRALFKQA